MADDEQREITGKIVEVTEKATRNDRPFANVKVEDTGGDIRTWTTWASQQAKALRIGKWYRLTVKNPPKDDGSGVWYNLETIGAQVPEPSGGAGGAGGSSGSPSNGNDKRPYKSDAQVVIERRSIERQGALSATIKLLEHGFNLADLADGDTLTTVLAVAIKIEDHYRRPVEADPATAAAWQDLTPQATEAATAIAEPEGRPTEPESPSDNGHQSFAHVGELMTRITKEFPGKGGRDVCELLGAKVLQEIDDLPGAYAKAKEAWA